MGLSKLASPQLIRIPMDCLLNLKYGRYTIAYLIFKPTHISSYIQFKHTWPLEMAPVFHCWSSQVAMEHDIQKQEWSMVQPVVQHGLGWTYGILKD